MNEETSESPKAFISYSRSSPEHEEWVLQLATELVEHGVDVILDKWSLREGDDKYVFMEKMVTDETIRKVIMICDKLFAEKADDREGGVGTETQIISPELYNKVEQQKFVAVIKEVDESGKPYLPTFLKTRIYINMSNPDMRAESFEELVRWIYDKPMHRKPELGKAPTYLFDDKKSLGTTSRYRQAMSALKQGKDTASGICQEYFETFAQNLEQFRIEREEGKEFDNQVVDSIKEFLPYRDEIVSLFMAIVRCRYDSELYTTIHRFLEHILPYGFRPSVNTPSQEWDYDNFKFILNELFIYAIAVFIKNERFDSVNEFLEQKYYFKSDSSDAPESRMAPYTWFNFYPGSLSHRTKRLSLKRLDLMADMHKERATRNDLPFVDIMQAEFILFLRSAIQPVQGGTFHAKWFPHSLLYASLRTPSLKPFEIFARAESEKYFNSIKIVLGVDSKDKLSELIEENLINQRELPQWEFNKVNPFELMNFSRLATEP